MNKLTNIFLAAILTIGIAGLIVSLNADQNIEQNLGFGGYNELGTTGVTNASTTVASTTATSILSANYGRMYTTICNDDSANAVYLHLTATDTAVMVQTGYKLTAGSCYTIGPDNLWMGVVYGIANVAPVKVTIVEK